MQQILTNIAWGLICAGLLALSWRLWRRGGGKKRGSLEMRTTAAIEELRSIGVLSVFKAVTKEIVTARDHSLGNVGKRYLEWLVTSRKMAMSCGAQTKVTTPIEATETNARRIAVK